MTRTWPPLVALGLLAACTPGDEKPTPDPTGTTHTSSATPPPCEPITTGEVWFQDKDGDCLNASLDCDDLDPDVNQADSMWQETICDGKDNNCDGQVDEGALDGWYLDADGDGYSGDAVGACSMPEPWSNDESLHLGVDCNDADADIYPDDPTNDRSTGRDIPGDGIDQDCDGVDACAAVCIGPCGFSTDEDVAEFCADFGQTPRLDVAWTANGAFDLHAADCLCAPPVELDVYTRPSDTMSLAGIEALWPSEILYIRPAYNSVTFAFRGFEGLREIPSPMVMTCGRDEDMLIDLHFDGLLNVERMAGFELTSDAYGCYTTDTAVDLTGLDSLRTIDQNLVLEGTHIQTLHGLEALEEVGGGLSIYDAPNLTDISALAGLRRVGSDLYISDPPADLSSLAAVQSIGGTLRLGGGNLPQFSQLEQLGGLILYDVESMDLGQFAWVTELPAGVLLSRCPVTSLAGLENVTSMGWWLRLHENPSLTSLDGLESLTSIDGYLLLEDNDSLATLTGLENLTTIDGDLEITGNDRLTQLDGLYGLQHVSGSIRIEDNAALTEEEIYAFLNNLGRENIGLSVFVDAVR